MRRACDQCLYRVNEFKILKNVCMSGYMQVALIKYSIHIRPICQSNGYINALDLFHGRWFVVIKGFI